MLYQSEQEIFLQTQEKYYLFTLEFQIDGMVGIIGVTKIAE